MLGGERKPFSVSKILFTLLTKNQTTHEKHRCLKRIVYFFTGNRRDQMKHSPLLKLELYSSRGSCHDFFSKNICKVLQSKMKLLTSPKILIFFLHAMWFSLFLLWPSLPHWGMIGVLTSFTLSRLRIKLYVCFYRRIN